MKRTMDQTADTFKLEGTYIAEVTATDDPKERDRVRVRVHGLMDSNSDSATCPWAEQCGMLFSGDQASAGISSAPKVGSLVYVMFLFGDVSLPVYYGYVRGGDDGSSYHTLSNLPSSSIVGPEPASLDGSSQYPLNNVIQTKAGVIYLDETPGNERIGIKHKSGSYIEIKPDGKVVYKSVSDSYEIVVGSKTTYVDGDSHYQMTGGLDIQATNISLN